MKYFSSCRSLDELKAEYRRLTLKYHPDVGGDFETMKEINLDRTCLPRSADNAKVGAFTVGALIFQKKNS